MATRTGADDLPHRTLREPHHPTSPPQFAFLVCAGLMAVLLAVGMALAIPNYDDTLLRILEIESPPRALFDSHIDQPLSGFLWWKLSELGLLWPAGIVANTIGWFMIAFVTFRLYCQFSRNAVAPAIAASVLAVAPILTEIQFVILSTGMMDVGCTALAYTATYVLFCQGPRVPVLSSALAAALALAANLFYFYGVPSVAAGAALLCVRGLISANRESLRRDVARATILAVAGMIGFAIYVTTADFSWRSGSKGIGKVDSTQALGSFSYVAPRLPILLVDGIWKGAGGAFFREVGMISFKGKPAMLGAGCGLGFALIMVLMVRRTGSQPSPPDVAGDLPTRWNSTLATSLVYCMPPMVVAMIPVLFMGRPLRDEEMISRYTIAMVPFASCLTTALITACVKPRYVLGATAFIVAISVDRAATEAYEAHRMGAEFRQWGDEIAKYVDPEGYTVAVVYAPFLSLDYTADDALNARLTADWPLEKRLRFWATPAMSSRAPHGTTAKRGLKRPEHVDRLLIVAIEEQGLTITQASPESVQVLTKPDTPTGY